MNNRQLVQAVIKLLGTKGVGPVRLRALMKWCKRTGILLEDFVKNPQPVEGALKAEQVAQLKGAADPTAVVDRLEAAGISVLLDSVEGYPASLLGTLGDKTPPILMVQGDIAVLCKPSVGFCGSRNATERGIATAQDCADQLARSGVNVTSGYAAGVDLAAHKASLKAGGTTTVVLAEGILNFRVKEDFSTDWDWSRLAVVSEFLPNAAWSVGHAMQRNATICGLSQAMILIEARSTGGSAEAGRTCVKMGLPLFASVYENGSEASAGNQDLIRSGAIPLLKSRATGRANLEKVFEIASNGKSVKAYSCISQRR